MNIKDLLPIGTVVLLKDGEKKLMICGILQTDADSGKEYNYMGLLYPEGYIGDQFQYLFNHEDIGQIVFRGYEDTERKVFIEKLAELYANR